MAHPDMSAFDMSAADISDADMSDSDHSSSLMVIPLTSALEVIDGTPRRIRGPFLKKLIATNPDMPTEDASQILTAIVTADGEDADECYAEEDETDVIYARKLVNKGASLSATTNLITLIFRKDLPLVKFVLNKDNGIGRHCITEELKRKIWAYESCNYWHDEVKNFIRGAVPLVEGGGGLADA